ncbi:hypothetical protein ABK905_09495 [Acerihabitans sp. KWT182]|uniref:Uncharacterized protein n=1 Tax=Acerihabitans sp. KWT182 TaxID=3157919 RepID=A0AAU7QDD8_9GAMM
MAVQGETRWAVLGEDLAVVVDLTEVDLTEVDLAGAVDLAQVDFLKRLCRALLNIWKTEINFFKDETHGHAGNNALTPGHSALIYPLDRYYLR